MKLKLYSAYKYVHAKEECILHMPLTLKKESVRCYAVSESATFAAAPVTRRNGEA